MSEENLSKRSLSPEDPKRVARGKDLYGYGEQKKKLNLTLTPKAIALLTDLAKQVELSRSEVMEQLLRNHSKALIKLFKSSKKGK